MVIEHQDGLFDDKQNDESIDSQLKTISDLILDLTRITEEYSNEKKAIMVLEENMKKRILTSLTRSSTNNQIFISTKEKEHKKSKAINYSKKTVTIQLQKRKKNTEKFLSKSMI